MSQSEDKKMLGVVGLGSMGYGAALTALRKGIDVLGLDTRAEARERFLADGGRVTDSLAELGAQCDAVLLLVVNAAQTEQVLFDVGGLASTLQPGAVVIASATVDPTLPPLWEARLAERGLWLIDAPVSGGAAKAAAGQMTVMASGKPEAFAAAGALLEAIAGKVYRLGERAGLGSTVNATQMTTTGSTSRGNVTPTAAAGSSRSSS